MMWQLVEEHIPAFLESRLSVRAGTQIPGNAENLPGFLRVQRGPGSDDMVTDSATVDVEAFAPTEHAAALLAEQARQAMHSLAGGRLASGMLIDSIRTVSSPMFIHYGSNLARYVAAYRITYRKKF